MMMTVKNRIVEEPFTGSVPLILYNVLLCAEELTLHNNKCMLKFITDYITTYHAEEARDRFNPSLYIMLYIM